jgi:ribose 5-phosphate isomerase B
MSPVSDPEIHAIVQRVLQRTVGGPAVVTPTEKKSEPAPVSAAPAGPSQKSKVIAIGTDHGGFELKENIKLYLTELGYSPVDVGTNDKNPVDYPDFALAVASLVSQGKAWRGIVIDGAGIGSCMCANKVPNVRAAMCYDYSSALNSREHNDANVLTLGAGSTGVNLARLIVKIFLTTEFLGGRHSRRIEKIAGIEKQFFKDGK